MLFSTPRIVSIIMLLAILFISLMLSSYVEGMDTASTTPPTASTTPPTATTTPPTAAATTRLTEIPPTLKTMAATEAGKTINKEAPASKTYSADGTPVPSDAITLGNTKNKLLTVADIRDALQNNNGVQQLLTSLPVKKPTPQ
jgi:hypothetical protein